MCAKSQSLLRRYDILSTINRWRISLIVHVLCVFSLQLFKNKAVELGEKLLPAFSTPTGIPRGVINLGRWVSELAFTSKCPPAVSQKADIEPCSWQEIITRLERVHIGHFSTSIDPWWIWWAKKKWKQPSRGKTCQIYYVPKRKVGICMQQFQHFGILHRNML